MVQRNSGDLDSIRVGSTLEPEAYVSAVAARSVEAWGNLALLPGRSADAGEGLVGLLPSLTLQDATGASAESRGAAAENGANLIARTAVALHELLQRPGNAGGDAASLVAESIRGLIFPSSDPNVVLALLRENRGSLSQIDEVYQNNFNVSLRDAISSGLSGDARTTALRYLDRRDDASIDADQINRALQRVLVARPRLVSGELDPSGPAMIDDPGARAAAERVLRETLGTLNSQAILHVDTEYQRTYGQSLAQAFAAATAEGGLSVATLAALNIYLRGSERRSQSDVLQLAEIAVQHRDIGMVREAFRGSRQDVRDAFSAVGGMQQLEAAFSGDELRFAREFATDGRLSLGTRLAANIRTPVGNSAINNFLSYRQQIDYVLTHLEPAERLEFGAGRELARAGREQAHLHGSEATAYRTYASAYEQLSRIGDAADIARWEDKVLTGGSLISALVETRQPGGGYDRARLLSQIENISGADWRRLAGRSVEYPAGASPSYKDEVMNALRQFVGDERDLQAADDLLTQQLRADSYQEARQNARRNLLSALRDATAANGAPNWERIYDSLQNMSSTDVQRYQSDSAYRAQVNNYLSGLVPGHIPNTYVLVAQRFLGRVAEGRYAERETGGAPKLDGFESVWLDWVQPPSSEKAIADLQRAFSEDPRLIAYLQEPANADTLDMFRTVAVRAVAEHGANAGRAEALRTLFETGIVPLELRVQIAPNHAGVYEALAHISEGERQHLQTDESYRNHVYGQAALSSEGQLIANNIVNQRRQLPEDLLRGFVLNDGTDFAEIRQIIARLSAEQIAAMKQAYDAKYGATGGTLISDLGRRIDPRQAEDIYRYLVAPSSSREALRDILDREAATNSGLGALLASMKDGTQQDARQSVDRYITELIRSTRSPIGDLTEDERANLVNAVYHGLDNVQGSKQQVAEVITNLAVGIATVSAGPFVGGGMLRVLTAAAGASAATRVGMSRLLEVNDDYNSSDLVGDALRGAAEGLLGGPLTRENVAALLALGVGAANRAAMTVKQALGGVVENSAALEQGLRRLMTNALEQGRPTVSREEIDALARSISSPGQETVVAAHIATSLDTATAEEARLAVRAATEPQSWRADAANRVASVAEARPLLPAGRTDAELAGLLEARFSPVLSRPNPDILERVFERMSLSERDRELTRVIMSQSGALTELDFAARLRAVNTELNDVLRLYNLTSADIKAVYVASASSDGNLAAYSFRKANHNRTNGILTLDDFEIEMAAFPDRTDPIVFFDDLSQLTPEQTARLREYSQRYNRPIIAVDTGFSSAVSVLDVALGEEAVANKLRSLLNQAHAYPSLSPEDALREVVALQDVVAADLGARVVRPLASMVSTADANWESTFSERILRYLEHYPADQRELIALDVLGGGRINTYAGMVQDLRTLHRNLRATLSEHGFDPNEVVYVVGVDGEIGSSSRPAGGSTNFISGLFRQANNIPPEKFLTIDQASRLQASGQLGNKRVVVLNDGEYSGNQFDTTMTYLEAAGIANDRIVSAAIVNYLLEPGKLASSFDTSYARYVPNFHHAVAAREPAPPVADTSYFQSLDPNRRDQLSAILREKYEADGGWKGMRRYTNEAFPYMAPDTTDPAFNRFLRDVYHIGTPASDIGH